MDTIISDCLGPPHFFDAQHVPYNTYAPAAPVAFGTARRAETAPQKSCWPPQSPLTASSSSGSPRSSQGAQAFMWTHGLRIMLRNPVLGSGRHLEPALGLLGVPHACAVRHRLQNAFLGTPLPPQLLDQWQKVPQQIRRHGGVGPPPWGGGGYPKNQTASKILSCYY
jgi:hypothetical protein